MSKIVFFPLNTNHVAIFASIIQWIEQPYEVLCHDRVSESKRYQTEALLKRLGLPYRHLRSVVKRSLNDNLYSRFRDFFRIKKSIVQYMEEVSPQVIVMAIDNDPLSQIVLAESKRRGIKTALVQEALIRPFEYTGRKTYLTDCLHWALRTFGIYLKYSEYGAGGCDRILVGGRIAKGILEGRGIEENRIRIVGHPKYDAMIAEMERFEPVLEDRTYLYAASTKVVQDEAHVRFLRKLVRASAKHGIMLIVKLHPRSLEEPSDIYAFLENEPRSCVQVIKEGDDAIEILKRSYALVTVSSTVILDALMMDRECVVADYLAGESRMEYDSYSAVHSIKYEDQVEEVVKASLENRLSYMSKRKLLEDELYLLDGNAGKRSAEAISAMVSRNM